MNWLQKLVYLLKRPGRYDPLWKEVNDLMNGPEFVPWLESHCTRREYTGRRGLRGLITPEDSDAQELIRSLLREPKNRYLFRLLERFSYRTSCWYLVDYNESISVFMGNANILFIRPWKVGTYEISRDKLGKNIEDDVFTMAHQSTEQFPMVVLLRQIIALAVILRAKDQKKLYKELQDVREVLMPGSQPTE